MSESEERRADNDFVPNTLASGPAGTHFEGQIGAFYLLDTQSGSRGSSDAMRWLPRKPVFVLSVDLGLPDRPGTEVLALCRSLLPNCESWCLACRGSHCPQPRAF